MLTKDKLKVYAELIDAELDKRLERDDQDIKPLLDSMRYSASAGGKRIRPYLTLLFCELLGGDIQKAIPYACAVELVHTYSLIHDDLPAMDNDDFRRGKPTNHKVFGEARAILAGDALLTYAFEVIADNNQMSAEDNLKAIRILAEASGAFGMVGGQEIDLDESAPKDYDKLVKMHRLKTGALIQGAAILGVLAAGKGNDEKIVNATRAYADAIGLTFQIVDDILDYTASYKQTGKTTSDARNHKTTFLTFMTAEEAFDKAVGITAEGVRVVSFLEGKKELNELARFLLFRMR